MVSVKQQPALTDRTIAYFQQQWASDFQNFDYLVAMDASNVSNNEKALRKTDSKIFRFLDITHHQKDVPDAYYTGDFQETYDLVVDGCSALLTKITQDYPHLLP